MKSPNTSTVHDLTTQNQTIKAHVLPGEPGGDTGWFGRQSAFERQEILRQVAFKRSRWPELADGHPHGLPNHTYPHILPAWHERKAFYLPLFRPIQEYVRAENIALHTDVLNLKSSQVACLNFLFPLRQDVALATAVLRPFLPDVQDVAEIKFEYTGSPEITQRLGEPASRRPGQNRTSIDAAIFWDDCHRRRHITLVEWKYTEATYDICRGYTGGSRDSRLRCEALDVTHDSAPEQSCRLASGQRNCSRRYWEYMRSAGIALERFAGVQGCPFRGPFYQLMRQYVLAACLRKLCFPAQVDVLVIGFGGNTELHRLPEQLRSLVSDPADGITEAWNSILNGAPVLRQITIEALMAQVDQAGSLNAEWRNYLRERYGI